MTLQVIYIGGPSKAELSAVKQLICHGNIGGIVSGDLVRADIHVCNTSEGRDEEYAESTQIERTINFYSPREIRVSERPSRLEKINSSGFTLANFNLLDQDFS